MGLGKLVDWQSGTRGSRNYVKQETAKHWTLAEVREAVRSGG